MGVGELVVTHLDPLGCELIHELQILVDQASSHVLLYYIVLNVFQELLVSLLVVLLFPNGLWGDNLELVQRHTLILVFAVFVICIIGVWRKPLFVNGVLLVIWLLLV